MAGVRLLTLPMERKLTAWRKNRKLGDVAGGRKWPKVEDHIVRREHSLKSPAPGQALPILIEDNPSRDYFFPITAEEARDHLRTFPEEDVGGITHLWLRRLSTRAFRAAGRPLAEYIWGSGARAIILYPFSSDGLLKMGRRRPAVSTQQRYSRWTTELVQVQGEWCLRWSAEMLRDFYLTALLGHEVGHHRDPHRRGKANGRQQGESAEQYALRWMPDGEELFVTKTEG